MKIVYQEDFVQDLESIRDGKLRQRALKAVECLANAKSLKELAQVKQLKGSKDAFRYRIGDYRLGFTLTDATVHLACFLHRSTIYRQFP